MIKLLDKRIEKLEQRVECVERLAGVHEQAVALIVRYGGIDGEHHKQWVLDQVLRLLAGDAYEEIVVQDERNDYSWSEGIPP